MNARQRRTLRRAWARYQGRAVSVADAIRFATDITSTIAVVRSFPEITGRLSSRRVALARYVMRHPLMLIPRSR